MNGNSRLYIAFIILNVGHSSCHQKCSKSFSVVVYIKSNAGLFALSLLNTVIYSDENHW